MEAFCMWLAIDYRGCDKLLRMWDVCLMHITTIKHFTGFVKLHGLYILILCIPYRKIHIEPQQLG